MRRPILILPAVAVLLLVPSSMRAQTDPDSVSAAQPALEEAALNWIDLLRAEAFDSAATYVAPAARRQFGGDQLAELWMGILGRFGELGELEPLESTTRGSFEVVQVRGSFERSNRALQISFDARGRVAGFVVGRAIQ